MGTICKNCGSDCDETEYVECSECESEWPMSVECMREIAWAAIRYVGAPNGMKWVNLETLVRKFKEEAE